MQILVHIWGFTFHVFQYTPFRGESLTVMLQAGDKTRSAGNRGFNLSERSMHFIGLLWGWQQMDCVTNIYKQAFHTGSNEMCTVSHFQLFWRDGNWALIPMIFIHNELRSNVHNCFFQSLPLLCFVDCCILCTIVLHHLNLFWFHSHWVNQTNKTSKSSSLNWRKMANLSWESEKFKTPSFKQFFGCFIFYKNWWFIPLLVREKLGQKLETICRN